MAQQASNMLTDVSQTGKRFAVIPCNQPCNENQYASLVYLHEIFSCKVFCVVHAAAPGSTRATALAIADANQRNLTSANANAPLAGWPTRVQSGRQPHVRGPVEESLANGQPGCHVGHHAVGLWLDNAAVGGWVDQPGIGCHIGQCKLHWPTQQLGAGLANLALGSKFGQPSRREPGSRRRTDFFYTDADEACLSVSSRGSDRMQ
eukprot:365716-Chlamydomonas_euryale.AAC.2